MSDRRCPSQHSSGRALTDRPGCPPSVRTAAWRPAPADPARSRPAGCRCIGPTCPLCSSGAVVRVSQCHTHPRRAAHTVRPPAAAAVGPPHLCAAIFSCLEFSGDMRGCRSCRVGEEGPLGMGIPVSPAVNVMLTAARLAPPPVPLAPCGTAARQGQIGVCATSYHLMGACTRGRRRERGGGGFTQASTMPDPATTHPPRARCEAKAAKVALTAR